MYNQRIINQDRMLICPSVTKFYSDFYHKLLNVYINTSVEKERGGKSEERREQKMRGISLARIDISRKINDKVNLTISPTLL